MNNWEIRSPTQIHPGTRQWVLPTMALPYITS